MPLKVSLFEGLKKKKKFAPPPLPKIFPKTSCMPLKTSWSRDRSDLCFYWAGLLFAFSNLSIAAKCRGSTVVFLVM